MSINRLVSSAILLIAFFVAGGALLFFVDVAKGQHLARAEESRAVLE